MTPFEFEKKQIDCEAKRTYMYFLSQLRIRVEMAFGLLTTKWRILRNGLNKHNATNKLIIGACAKLHNFCICNKIERTGSGLVGQVNLDSVRENPSTFVPIKPLVQNKTNQKMGYLETVNEDGGNKDGEAAHNTANNEVRDCHWWHVSDDSRRDELVADIMGKGLSRPNKNIRRNG